ncbi:class I SAM-dependent methyltransferase [Pseudalkalibacillus caeni]|uniref:Methyltransferase domain-containing protein n=1 Tax=Exobacillus caeni TaxID=2574798 RepID=A0A5R9FCZ8_9BACL|nr:methyltransferase domain-containing protein [Pseudalkalibacillus caeni]TLS38753.1 methyltransferase domain-containing protein [Pseudalkalibacillus caeni]
MAGHRFNPEKAEKLHSPERTKLLPPDQILSMLELGPSDHVADLGAGSGFFTLPIAKQVTTVYAVDIEPKMLDVLKGRAEEAEVDNVEFVISDLENVQLDDNSVDKAINAFVAHEIPDLPKALNELKRILKPTGQALLLDWAPVEHPEAGPPAHERIPVEKLQNIVEENGFQTEERSINPNYYILVLKPINS